MTLSLEHLGRRLDGVFRVASYMYSVALVTWDLLVLIGRNAAALDLDFSNQVNVRSYLPGLFPTFFAAS